ncbi:MAG: hypothetical protein ABSH37_13730 [Bryobacteraceae bacterium]|jgi:hypothetical protein
MRLRRKGVGSARVEVRGLSHAQRFDLLYGIGAPMGQESFRSPAEYAEAWRKHREALMEACGPFHRPAAFWDLEAHYIPQLSESEESVLMRLGLPLTATEMRILAARKVQASAN